MAENQKSPVCPECQVTAIPLRNEESEFSINQDKGGLPIITITRLYARCNNCDKTWMVRYIGMLSKAEMISIDDKQSTTQPQT